MQCFPCSIIAQFRLKNKHKSLLPDKPKAGSYNYKGCTAQMHLKENILQYEQHRQNIHQRFHLLALAANQMQYHIGNDPDGDAL